jgi:hypothetical protein
MDRPGGRHQFSATFSPPMNWWFGHFDLQATNACDSRCAGQSVAIPCDFPAKEATSSALRVGGLTPPPRPQLVAQLQAFTGTSGAAAYKLTIPPTDGFVYVKLVDPFGGTKALGTVMRSDAKQMPPENVWMSRSRNTQSKLWEYWINVFDVNTPGVYESSFQAPAGGAAASRQFVPTWW